MPARNTRELCTHSDFEQPTNAHDLCADARKLCAGSKDSELCAGAERDSKLCAGSEKHIDLCAGSERQQVMGWKWKTASYVLAVRDSELCAGSEQDARELCTGRGGTHASYMLTVSKENTRAEEQAQIMRRVSEQQA
jgi:hypothetical protein